MNPLMGGMGMGQQEGTNLFSIIINLIFGFVLGLIVFLGFEMVFAYGTKLAGDLIKMTGYGAQMSAFGFATTALPYVVLAPVAGLVVKQLTAVRSLKSFAIFAVTVAIGFAVAFFAQGYFLALMQA